MRPNGVRFREKSKTLGLSAGDRNVAEVALVGWTTLPVYLCPWVLGEVPVVRLASRFARVEAGFRYRRDYVAVQAITR